MITYTNHVETVTDSYNYLMTTEFSCEVTHAKDFESGKLTRGEYHRYYLSEQPILAFFSDGVTRDYTFSCSWYFDTRYYEFQKMFDSIVSDRIERYKRLFINNRYYSPSSVYKWHNVSIETEESYYLGEEDESYEGYEHILNVPINLIITRSDIN